MHTMFGMHGHGYAGHLYCTEVLIFVTGTL